MNNDEIKDVFRKAIDCIDYVEYIEQFHDCNDCGKRKCPHRPKMGEFVRINCFDWESIKK